MNVRPHRWLRGSALVAVACAVAFLALPALASVPARLGEGCGKWIATAAILELLSAAGFVVFYKLVFGPATSWRQMVPAALNALGASTILPAGGMIGPTIGAYSAGFGKPSASQLARLTTTFVILTSAPSLIVVTALGALLWLGVATGPHQAPLTMLPAALALALLTITWVAGGCCGSRQTRRRLFSRRLTEPTGALRAGIIDAQALIRAANWKLVGALAYYVFDNAVLWATFHAYGRAPALGVVMMGYLVGSLAGAVPLPAGLGALDGGLIGALVLYGAPPAPAGAAVLLYRGISLSVPVVLGATGWICSRSDRRQSASGRRKHPSRPAPKKRRAAREPATVPAD